MGLKRIKDEEGDTVARRALMTPAPQSSRIKANDESDRGYESRCENKASLSLCWAFKLIINVLRLQRAMKQL